MIEINYIYKGHEGFISFTSLELHDTLSYYLETGDTHAIIDILTKSIEPMENFLPSEDTDTSARNLAFINGFSSIKILNNDGSFTALI
ncbi:hypothetical protein [Photobacterium alginatilyticum]|uniref:CdiI immunity protein domain-containing protein n=1 Tax=Photobacterium alginatilyticum TaxID=1775171 RepID=A0ABW9YQH3_9GAMM|nr:hypothetical protein [Photobacterium alginatilyticum]NBI56137.1 hypothetical protein [Photobacterium alginatilyticum]